MLTAAPPSRSEDSNRRPPGTPGTPGSRDLEAALRRLSLRRDNYLSEKRFFEEERERKLAYLAKEDEKEGGENSSSPATPTESLFSLCSHPSLWSGYSFTSRSYLPEKLQIVKPLEGDYSDRARQHPPHTQTDRGQSRARDGRHHSQYVVFDNHSPSRIYLRALRGPQTLRRSSSLLELSGQPSLPLHLGAPLALVAGLLEAMEIQGGALNLQHSFYFRHTQPRCWFELWNVIRANNTHSFFKLLHVFCFVFRSRKIYLTPFFRILRSLSLKFQLHVSEGFHKILL